MTKDASTADDRPICHRLAQGSRFRKAKPSATWSPIINGGTTNTCVIQVTLATYGTCSQTNGSSSSRDATAPKTILARTMKLDAKLAGPSARTNRSSRRPASRVASSSVGGGLSEDCGGSGG